MDLTQPGGLTEALSGVEAVVDVTQGPVLNVDEATEFFSTAARNLGQAATAAGVGRTVLLSIIGIDRMQDIGYFVAKLAHERASRENAPGLTILRAAQFHDFAGQVLDWGRDGEVAHIDDQPTQPVALGEVIRVLLELADGTLGGEFHELAGPKVERLLDMVRQVIASRGEAATINPRPVSATQAGGAGLAGPNAILAGPTFSEWLEARPRA